MRPLRRAARGILAQGSAPSGRAPGRAAQASIDTRARARLPSVARRCTDSSFTQARHEGSRSIRTRSTGRAGRSRGQTSALFVSWDRAPRARKGHAAVMFVVMASTATEAEILGVKSRILAEGMTPYDHHG